MPARVSSQGLTCSGENVTLPAPRYTNHDRCRPVILPTVMRAGGFIAGIAARGDQLLQLASDTPSDSAAAARSAGVAWPLSTLSKKRRDAPVPPARRRDAEPRRQPPALAAVMPPNSAASGFRSCGGFGMPSSVTIAVSVSGWPTLAVSVFAPSTLTVRRLVAAHLRTAGAGAERAGLGRLDHVVDLVVLPERRPGLFGHAVSGERPDQSRPSR